VNQENEPVAGPQIIHETQSLSIHAQQRLAQRNLDQDAIDYVLQHGRVIRRTGILFYVLAARDIPRHDRRNSSVSRLIGTTILVSHDGTIITVYRNRRSLRAIVRKHKQWVDMRQRKPQAAAIESSTEHG
jgi:hypothetical protein